MKKLTKEMIEELGNKVVDICINNGYDYTSVYFNGKRVHIGHVEMNLDGDDLTFSAKPEITEDCHPGDYFEYFNHNHILSMSFEGYLYDLLYEGNHSKALDKVFEEYGVTYEIGNYWNLSVYPVDDMEVEGMRYEKKPEVTYINWFEDAEPELKTIMDFWYERSKAYGDKGSCVLGAGFEFEWKGKQYFMIACSPWQGSLSWESSVDDVETSLKNIGATNIKYNWGRMD